MVERGEKEVKHSKSTAFVQVGKSLVAHNVYHYIEIPPIRPPA